jgi:hypothetical protein
MPLAACPAASLHPSGLSIVAIAVVQRSLLNPTGANLRMSLEDICAFLRDRTMIQVKRLCRNLEQSSQQQSRRRTSKEWPAAPIATRS